MSIRTGGNLNKITGKPQDKMYRYTPNELPAKSNKRVGAGLKRRGSRRGGFMWGPLIAGVAPVLLDKLLNGGRGMRRRQRRGGRRCM